MADIEVTIPEELIQDLFTSDRGMELLVEEVLNQVMEAEMTEFLQADTYERTDQRRGYRNGSRERDMTCRVGDLTLEVPRDRAGDFSTELFDRLQRNEQALVATLMEIVVNGVSTRRVKNITNELCGTDFAKSTVSDLCKDLDDTVDTWNNRDLHKEYPFVLVDAMYIKVRRESGVQPTSLLMAVGVNEDGYREIIGLRVANSESKQSWLEMFRWLKDRGLDGVDLVVSDDHKGLRQAVYRCFQGGARWQRCQEHFKRNLKDKVSASVWSDFKPALDCVFKADSPTEAREQFQELAHRFEGRADDAIRSLEAGLEDAIAVLSLPKKYRKRLRTTNMIERLIQEARRREKVIRIFPNASSARRLLGAYIQEKHEKWSTGHRYLKMDEFYEWKESLDEEEANELRAAE